MIRIKLVLLAFGLFSLSGCLCGGDDDFGLDPIELDCFETVITPTNQFDTTRIPFYSAPGFSVEGNYLKATLAFSGCDPNRDFKLLVDEARIKTNPPQQNAKIVFEEQFCQAFFQVPVCFDISNLERPVNLRLETSQGTQIIRIN